MKALAKMAQSETHGVWLECPDDFEAWRDKARQMLVAGIRPEQLAWRVSEEDAGDLFATNSVVPVSLTDGDAPGAPRASRHFIRAAQTAILHEDPGRFALLYRLLWRLQEKPALLHDEIDDDVRQLHDLIRSVRRDIHKMRAFLRFRMIEDERGEDHYVAWFEPQHHILRANASFFVNRFTQMRWSILTPRGSLYWDGKVLQEGPPSDRSHAPTGDAVEDLWRTYFASIFNPARLKVGMMLKEMPKKYWKNMPEAALIPDLIAGARAREVAMVAQGKDAFSDREISENLSDIATSIGDCRACPIGCNGTRAVAGEGPANARLMIVGEQPGDVEESKGRVFVGPAGKVLDTYLVQAGIDRGAAYLTNAVKHFKYEARRERRIHRTPTAREIDTCRWWLERERALVKPDIVIALGASAARGLLGRSVSVEKERGQPIVLDDASRLIVTSHPSYLLRLEGDAQVQAAHRFARDLRIAASTV